MSNSETGKQNQTYL